MIRNFVLSYAKLRGNKTANRPNHLTLGFVNSDVVVVTGDLVDGSVQKLKEAAEPLRDIQAKHGKYFISGKSTKSYNFSKYVVILYH